MQELCYTSIAQGLDRGKTGYTTAGRTDGMTRTVADMAEKISGFIPLNPNNPMAYASEPVTFSHLVWQLSGRKIHIVSRNGACPPDYTGRSNFLAHHAMLTAEEAAACRGGPAVLLGDDGFLMKAWQGPARLLQPRSVPALFDRERTTAALEAAGLAPGWGDALADRLRDPAVRQTWLIYSLDMDILGIVADVFSHLEPAKRWATTFATHATRSFPGPGVECQLQCVVSGTDYARDVLTRQAGNAFDLTKRAAPPPRRQLASTVVPAGGNSTGSRGLAPATAPSRARTQPTAATAAPVEVEDLSSILAQAASIPAVPRRKTGFAALWPWVAALSLAVLMTALSGLFGYLLFGAKQKIAALEDQIGDLKDDHKKAVKDLKEAERRAQAAENKAQAAEQQASNDKKLIEDLKGQLAARNEKPAPSPPASKPPTQPNEEPAEVATQEPPTQQTTTSTDVPASPPKEEGSKTIPPPAEAPATISDNTGKTATPRIHPGLIENLATALKHNAKSNVVLLTGLSEQPASHAIEIVPGPSAKLLEAKCEKKGRETVLQVLGGKKAAEFVCDEKTQELKLEVDPKNPNAFLLKYLTLEVRPTGGSPISIPLGKPVNAKLAIGPAATVDRETQDKEKTKHFRAGCLYRLFADGPPADEANNQLSLLLAYKLLEEKKLVEAFKFADGKVSTRMQDKNPLHEKTFAFYTSGTTGAIGVQFVREYPEIGKPDQPPTYKANGWYVPLKSADTKSPWLKKPAFEESDFKKIVGEATQALNWYKAKSTDKDKKAVEPFHTNAKNLEAAMKVDETAWKEAAFGYPWQDLFNGIPFRLTLRPLASRDEDDVGIVVVDSLGSGGPAMAGQQGGATQ